MEWSVASHRTIWYYFELLTLRQLFEWMNQWEIGWRMDGCDNFHQAFREECCCILCLELVLVGSPLSYLELFRVNHWWPRRFVRQYWKCSSSCIAPNLGIIPTSTPPSRVCRGLTWLDCRFLSFCKCKLIFLLNTAVIGISNCMDQPASVLLKSNMLLKCQG